MKHVSTNIGTYYGGKGSSGTPQKIINQIPPHKVFVSGFLGACSVVQYKAPAPINLGIDKAPDIIKTWRKLYYLSEEAEDALWRFRNTGF